MYLLKHRWSRLARNAWRNRQELIGAGMTTRRDLLKLGLLTGSGYLLAKHGLSSRVADANEMRSPRTDAFVEPLPIPPVKRPLANGASGLNPPPQIEPNWGGGEGRREKHQAFEKYKDKFSFPPKLVYEIRQNAAPVYVSPKLPMQTLWGFDGISPGPTYYARYGEDALVRNRNELPYKNGGFGNRQVSTHLHNGHTPSESDGFPMDYFPDPDDSRTKKAWFYDQHYPHAKAGFSMRDSDPNEELSTCWYHDHRNHYTSQNVYKGLAGFYLIFNEKDCGDETNAKGFRLPGVRDPNDFYAPVKYDVPLFLADRTFDGDSGLLFFDLFEKDGILGDKFLVNGKIQPYFEVEPRRYRFRVLNGGPSRFYQLFLTDKAGNTSIPFWQVATDGNLLPHPCKVSDLVLSVSERADIVVDFSKWAGKTLYLENRWLQLDGRGPEGNIGDPLALLAPGRGDFMLQFRVGSGAVEDRSVDFEKYPNVKFYDLPKRQPPRITRSFRFDRELNFWTINRKIFQEGDRFKVKQGSAEHWIFENKSGGWMHPIHVHFEEFQMLSRNGKAIGPGNVEYARKDTARLQHGEFIEVFFRFRDFDGRYVMHCHNVLHEDHDMMLQFGIDQSGDGKRVP